MSDRYLLDSNVLSHLIRMPDGPVTRRIRSVGEANVCTSIIVAAELRFGARKKGSVALTERVEALLASLEVLPFDGAADDAYAGIRFELESGGQSISANDLLIAAQALDLGLVLVTDNVREFGRVSGLKLENWLDELVPTTRR